MTTTGEYRHRRLAGYEEFDVLGHVIRLPDRGAGVGAGGEAGDRAGDGNGLRWRPRR
ncbi:MAG: hypothetical protein U0W40_05625 [Acidimicrobiia bacterium]